MYSHFRFTINTLCNVCPVHWGIFRALKIYHHCIEGISLVHWGYIISALELYSAFGGIMICVRDIISALVSVPQ